MTLSPTQSGGQSEKPSGRGGEGAAFILSSRTRRSLKLESVSKIKGYFSPSRWEIVVLMSLWHLTFFQGTFQIPAHLILMTAGKGLLLSVSSYR